MNSYFLCIAHYPSSPSPVLLHAQSVDGATTSTTPTHPAAADAATATAAWMMWMRMIMRMRRSNSQQQDRSKDDNYGMG
jgi:hypothetical protein